MNINRFYELSELFNDDERIIAHAIVMFSSPKQSAEEIHKDLLDCDFNKWEKELEITVKELTRQAIGKFKELIASNLKSGRWVKDDFQVLSESAWKLKPVKKVKLKRKIVCVKRDNLFDFYGVTI